LAAEEIAMKRFGYLALLMILNSSAHATSYSFVLHGHRVQIERPRHCFSRSCLSVTVPGLYGAHQDSGVDNTVIANPNPALAKPAAPLAAAPPSRAPTQATPAAPALASPPPAPTPAPTQNVALTATAPRAVALPTPVPPVPRAEPPDQVPWIDRSPATVDATATASQRVSQAEDTPLGDWQTQGDKDLVRIESCGAALCGYLVDPATNTRGETVLINMKPNGPTDWTGTIISRTSGSTNYAKMVLKPSTTLRVEACAIGHFLCTGNDWSRIVTRPQALATSR
jgi:uncharacterized protein (DUF2147 family)